MTTLPLVTSDWRRDTPHEPATKVLNRFFEKNPTNLEEGSSLIVRPGFKKFSDYPSQNGTMNIYTQEGMFFNDIFVHANDGMYRRSADGGTNQKIDTAVPPYTFINTGGVFEAGIGDNPGYFFFLDGFSLSYYGEQSAATTRLIRTGSIPDGSVVQIGNTYYKWTSGSVDAGTPNGTSANPWLLALSDAASGAMNHLQRALLAVQPNLGYYSSNTLRNTQVNVVYSVGTEISLVASVAGASGNLIQAVSGTPELTFTSSPTFTGGGNSPTTSYPIYMPSGFGGPISLGVINSYVIVIPQEGDRFYWMEPGETQINPLNFATAELTPDTLVGVQVVGEQIYFLGTDTIEVWYSTGNVDAPFRRQAGLSQPFGVEKWSDITIGDYLMFISDKGYVYQAQGTSFRIISNNSISERIRKFINTDEIGLLDSSFRVWKFELDGHYFYIINIGTEQTLVYDLSTEQWAVWSSNGETYLRPSAAVKWSSPAAENRYVVGDCLAGTLYLVDAEVKVDSDPNADTVSLIPTMVTAGMPMRTRETARINQLYLTGSVGYPTGTGLVTLVDNAGATIILTDDMDNDYELIEFSEPFEPGVRPNHIRLEYSDDNGKTWIVADQDVEILENSFNQEVVWRSLGTMSAPGRLFRISDYASMARIDGLDVQ